MGKEQSPARPSPDVEETSPETVKYERCLSGLELKIEAKPLKELDPTKLKNEIKRWARAVVRYARQLSRSLSSRRSAASAGTRSRNASNSSISSSFSSGNSSESTFSSLGSADVRINR